METKKHSPQFLRQRKLMTVLPLLALPSVIVTFWALDGGKAAAAEDARQTSGINTVLPDAHFKKGKEKDKMAIYEETGKDSAKLRDQIKNDPYYDMENPEKDTIKSTTTQLQNILKRSASKYNQPGLSRLQTSTSAASADSSQRKLMEKLSQLKKVLNKKTTADPHGLPDEAAWEKQNPNRSTGNLASPEINKLERLMQMSGAGSGEPDPELDRLNGMLDKVMLIQHPEKLQDSMRRLSEKNRTLTFVVTAGEDEKNITLMESHISDAPGKNRFYGLSGDEVDSTSKQNAIEAIIPESQTLVSGATVKLRLASDIFVAGIRIPRDEYVYGTAGLSNERLKITISSLRYRDNILPVFLEVYDMDGMAGIYIPGSIDRDVSKQSAGDAISSIGLTTMDPTVGAEAASAGIQAAKTLASRKIKLVRVTVRSGYRVLLKDSGQKAAY
jgi:conjugative transposon TraM protein